MTHKSGRNYGHVTCLKFWDSMITLSASAVVIHYEEALYQVYGPFSFISPERVKFMELKLYTQIEYYHLLPSPEKFPLKLAWRPRSRDHFRKFSHPSLYLDG